MSNIDELAAWLSGTERLEGRSGDASATRTVVGTATTDSESGTVSVYLGADVIGSDASIEIPTTMKVEEGDEVIVSLLGTGGANPIVTGVVGSGDKTDAKADEAKEAAEAVSQHFWSDDDGAHVATVEGEASQGPNMLLTSNGVYVRVDGAKLTGQTQQGFFVYDRDTGLEVAKLSNKGLQVWGPYFSELEQEYIQVPLIDIGHVTRAGTHGDPQPYITIGDRSVQPTTDDGWYTASIGFDNTVNPTYSAAIGYGLTTGNAYQVVLGRHNEATTGAILVVGNGTYNNPSNAFIVGTDGSIDVSGDTYMRGDIIKSEPTLKAPQTDEFTVYGCMKLYSGTYSQAKSAAITLSSSAANFAFLDVETTTNEGVVSMTRVYNPNGKIFNVTSTTAKLGGAWSKIKEYKINGTVIDTWNDGSDYRRAQWGYDGTVTRDNFIAITAVYGWK